MSSQTTNLNLTKIDLTDAPPDITVLNANWDKLDQVVSNKMNKHLLQYDGDIKENGVRLTFPTLYNMLLVNPDFVVLVNDGEALHPNVVNNDEIVFVTVDPKKTGLTGRKITMTNDGYSTVTLDETSDVPSTRKVNGKPLSNDINLTKSDIGLENVYNNPNRISTYSAFSQIGLNNTSFSQMTSFLDAMILIHNSLPSYSIIQAPISTDSLSNLLTLTVNKVKTDITDINFTTSSTPSFIYQKFGNVTPAIVTILPDNIGSSGIRDTIVQAVFDFSSEVPNISKFSRTYHPNGFQPTLNKLVDTTNTISTYSSLSDLDLSDSNDMVETDFLSNMQKIYDTFTSHSYSSVKTSILYLTGSLTLNIFKSVQQQINTDVTSAGVNNGGELIITRVGTSLTIKFREAHVSRHVKQYVCHIYRGANTWNVGSFELIQTSKPTPVWHGIATLSDGTSVDNTVNGYYEFNGLVIVDLKIPASTVTFTGYTGVTMFTLPVGYRPSREVQGGCYALVGGTQCPFRAYVHENGQVKVYNGGNTKTPDSWTVAQLIFPLE